MSKLLKTCDHLALQVLKETDKQKKELMMADLLAVADKFIRRQVHYISRGVYFNGVIDEEDLYQVGRIGFIRALEKTDISLGDSFMTYARYWVDRYIYAELRTHSFCCRMPEYGGNKIYKAMKYDSVDELEPCLKQLLNPVNTDDLAYEYELDTNIIKSQVIDYVFINPKSRLTDREKKYLRKYYGFDGKAYTLEALAKEDGITRERVRQIIATALRKLRYDIPRKVAKAVDVYD